MNVLYPQTLLDTLRQTQRVTVLTGAGISAESGVPTFRDAQTGLWAQYNPEDLAKKGLRRIQIEGDEQEYLLDNEGNIYNLQGEFVGTTGDDDEEDGGDAAA